MKMKVWKGAYQPYIMPFGIGGEIEEGVCGGAGEVIISL